MAWHGAFYLPFNTPGLPQHRTQLTHACTCTPQAHKVEVQSLLQRMCADLISERPDKPLDYMRKWIEAETERTKAQ